MEASLKRIDAVADRHVPSRIIARKYRPPYPVAGSGIGGGGCRIVLDDAMVDGHGTAADRDTPRRSRPRSA